MMHPNTPQESRHLNWPLCYNTRDLGGLPTRDGQITLQRAVIRSDILSRLTAEGQRALFEYGVRTVIDLRPPHEIAKEPPADFTLSGCSVNYLNLPIEKYYPHVSALMAAAQSRSEAYGIVLDNYPDAVVEIVRAIANAQTGGVVVHCHAGSDRTGIIAGLLLDLASVPADIIAADYAESLARLEPVYGKPAAQLIDDPSIWKRPTVTIETMHAMLKHIDVRYGGTENYLCIAGLTPEETSRLKKRFITND